jgi:O-succinylbenzoate synthase
MRDARELGQLLVRRVELYPVGLPQTTDLVSHAAVATASRPVVYVRVLGQEGEEGWGECCALGDPSYTHESMSLSFGVLSTLIAPIVMHAGPIGAQDVRRVLDPKIKEWNMAKAAIEAAVLDALLRRNEMSLVSFLEGKRSLIPAGATVGFPKGVTTHERLDAYAEEVQARFSEGYRRVRIKATPHFQGDDWTVLPIKTLRDRNIDGILQPDGNMAYSVSHTPQLARLRDHGVQVIEQPFGRRRFLDHRMLRNESDLAVVADESIESFDDVLLALDKDFQSFDGICNKWSRVGGILEAARINEECLQRGARVFMGGMIGVGTHVDLALAAMIPDELDLIGDHGPSGKWVAAEADPTPAIHWNVPGFVAPSQGFGVVDIAIDRVRKGLVGEVVTLEV